MKLIEGIGASKGIAIAKAYKIEELSLDIAKETKNIATEIKVFEDALSNSFEASSSSAPFIVIKASSPFFDTKWHYTHDWFKISFFISS